MKLKCLLLFLMAISLRAEVFSYCDSNGVLYFLSNMQDGPVYQVIDTTNITRIHSHGSKIKVQNKDKSGKLQILAKDMPRTRSKFIQAVYECRIKVLKRRNGNSQHKVL